MLEIIGAGPAGKASKDWPAVWRDSDEATEVKHELTRIHEVNSAAASNRNETQSNQSTADEFAMPFIDQLWWVTHRVFQQYWREPAYIGAKFMLGIASALFIGFSFFQPDNTEQGFQDTLFSIFMVNSIFSTLVQQ